MVLDSFSNVSKGGGVLLSVILLSSLLLITSFEGADAADDAVTASSTGFEKTVIIEFENSGKEDVKTFRLWLGSDVIFKSFKTEKGWTGTKTPQGVLIFTATDPLKPGETVKFGVKTDKEKSGINWKALDEKGEQVGTAKTPVTDVPVDDPVKGKSDDVNTPGDDPAKGKSPDAAEAAGILPESSFRLVPEKPNVGSTIRVAGENFGADQELDFYIGGKKLDTFRTDGSGSFIFTTKIPKDEKADRVKFVVKDKQENEKPFSLRLGEAPNGKMTHDQDIPLTIDNFPSKMYRGDVLLIKGTGNPGSSITATVTDPDGNILTTNSEDISPDGRWTYQTIVPIDISVGEYSAVITDGKHEEVRTWMIESGKKIQFVPSKIEFEPGEPIRFNGTAVPNERLEVILENPQGSEVFSNIIDVDSTGFVELEFVTTLADSEGTYVLFAFQDEDTAITLVGLGEPPEARLIVKTDQANYDSGDIVKLTIDGPPSSSVSLTIIDPSDKTKFSDSITLDHDGTKDYNLDLAGFSSGVYSVVISKAGAVAEDEFSVELGTGTDLITIQTTKTDYEPGDPIFVLGNSGDHVQENILIKVALIDPDGNEVKIKETFTDKEGRISVDSFRVPSDAKAGTWKIDVRSGSIFDIAEFNVLPTIEKGMSIIISDISPSPNGRGDLMTIQGFGAAASKSVQIEIIAGGGEVVKNLSIISTGSGEFTTPWLIPPGITPGTYVVNATDSFNFADTTVELE